MNEMLAPELERTVSVTMESEKDGEKRTAFEEDETDLELQMKALSCGMMMHRNAVVTRPSDDNDESSQVGKPQQPFWGYRYMTPLEFADDEPVTAWTIIRTFEDDTGIHGVEHVGRAIGKSNQFESYSIYAYVPRTAQL